MLMEKQKKMRVLQASDWLQIWTAASSLDVKGNKAIKENFVFLANRLVFPNTVTYTSTQTSRPITAYLHVLGNKSQVVLCQAYIQAFFDVLFACMEKRVKGQWFARGFCFHSIFFHNNISNSNSN